MRTAWVYPVVAAVIAFLIMGGMPVRLGTAILVGIGLTGAVFGMNYLRYRAFLLRPQTRQVYRNVVVSLSGDEIREHFTDGSHLAIKLYAVKAFRQVGDFYFVLAPRRNGIAVPVTAFESPDESREFADRIRQAAGRA